jgi:hypothetical protein
MQTYYIDYAVYDGSFILTEGEMPINATTRSQAENAVRAMFRGNEVIIRNIRG